MHRFFAFDFHKECKGMKFENALKLIDSLQEHIDKFNVYFWIERAEGEKHSEDKLFCSQEVVFRTNCMDCLDRTNVIQSSIARYVLSAQMVRFGINIDLDGEDKNEEDIEFNNIFNHSKYEKNWSPFNLNTYVVVWADNGDAISFAYTGTDALKGDFTRYDFRNNAYILICILNCKL